jgi:hypothetical protein
VGREGFGIGEENITAFGGFVSCFRLVRKQCKSGKTLLILNVDGWIVEGRPWYWSVRDDPECAVASHTCNASGGVVSKVGRGNGRFADDRTPSYILFCPTAQSHLNSCKPAITVLLELFSRLTK